MESKNFIYHLISSKLAPIVDTDKTSSYSKSVHIDESKEDTIYVKVVSKIRFEGRESKYEYVYSVPYGQELMNILEVLPEIVHSTFGIHLGITIALYDFKVDFIPTLYEIKEDLDSNPFVFRP